MTGRVEHTDVAAYSLGLLEAEDRHAFELHLRQCPQCREELHGLRGLSSLLHGLDKTLATPTATAARSDNVHVLLRRTDEDRRRHVRTRRLVAAAMVVVLPLGGGLTWAAVSGPDSGSGGRPTTASSRDAELTSSGEQFTGISPGTVKATVSLDDHAWGSEVSLQVTGVQGPLLCRLVVLDHSGTEETVMSWHVEARGKGTTADAKPLVLHGSVATARDDIDRFEVRASDGEVLSTVPIP